MFKFVIGLFSEIVISESLSVYNVGLLVLISGRVLFGNLNWRWELPNFTVRLSTYISQVVDNSS